MEEGVTPYLGSAQWYAFRWFGIPYSGPIRPNRTLVAPGKGLAIPVCGGSKTIRNGGGEDAVVSGHGNWARIHLGAFEAAYGREPFWRFLEAEVAEILKSAPGRMLAEVNGDLDKMLHRFLRPDVIVGEWGRISPADRRRLRAYGVSLAEECPSGEVAMLGRAAMLGRDSVLTLLA